MDRRSLRRSLALAALFGGGLISRPAAADPVSLPDVVRAALQRNERSDIASMTVVSADAAVAKARAGFLPTVTLSGSEAIKPYDVKTTQTVASGTLTVNQPLLVATAFPLYSGAKHGFESARLDAVEQRRRLAFDAARAFFAVVAQQRVRSAAESRLERAEASLNDTRARVGAQLVSSNDVTRAEVDHASAEQTVASATTALARAQLELDYVANATISAEIVAPAESLAPWALDLNDLVRRAITQRPDLGSLRESSLAAAALAKEPGLRFVPTLSAQAQGRVSDQNIAPQSHFDSTITVNLNWAIWDAGIRAADADSRAASARVATLQERALLRQVYTDVQTAITEIAGAQRALRAAEQALDASKRNVDETEVLYKQGLAKAIERVDANGSRFDADVANAAANLALRQAELDLRAAIGLYPVDGVK